MTATPTSRARLMSTADLAELLGLTESTVKRMRARGDGPPFLLFGKTVRYHPARVQQWMAAQEQGTPAGSRATPSTKRGAPAPNGGAPRG